MDKETHAEPEIRIKAGFLKAKVGSKIKTTTGMRRKQKKKQPKTKKKTNKIHSAFHIDHPQSGGREARSLGSIRLDRAYFQGNLFL